MTGANVSAVLSAAVARRAVMMAAAKKVISARADGAVNFLRINIPEQ
jgi:hypothetical protein